MDLASLAFPTLNLDFLVGVLQIILIDLVLAGDNAVVIALAVASLPREQRLMGIVLGAGLAVVLRIALTFFAAQLLLISYVKLIGGVLIFWIACKLLLQDAASDEEGQEAATIWAAIWIIVVADVTMSTDNVLALAAASKGSLFLLIFGLILSIPLVVGTSTLLSRLMERYPIIVYAGAAVLGKVSAEMIFTDPAIVSVIHVSDPILYVLEAVFALAVIGVSKLYVRSQKPEAEVQTVTE